MRMIEGLLLMLMHGLQLVSKSTAGMRAKLVAREIDILQRELDTKAVVYIMGRAHVRMRPHANSAFDWYVTVLCSNFCLPWLYMTVTKCEVAQACTASGSRTGQCKS